jgi:hypothetical protein
VLAARGKRRRCAAVIKLILPADGREVEQGSAEDRATWWTCSLCHYTGPFVMSTSIGDRRCFPCGGETDNPHVPRALGYRARSSERAGAQAVIEALFGWLP